MRQTTEDDDLVIRGNHGACAPDVFGDRVAKLRDAARVGVGQVAVRELAQCANERRLPLAPGEGVEVRLTGPKLVTNFPGHAAGRTRLHGGCKRLRHGRVGDTRTGPCPRRQVSLDCELRVAVDNDAPRYAKLLRKHAARR